MRTEQNTETNFAPRVKSAAPWRLVKVHAISDFKLEVKFVDGLEGVVDLSHLVHSEDAGVFAVLKDEKVFQQVTLEYGAVSWPIGLDLAPDAMYDEIKETGVFSL